MMTRSFRPGVAIALFTVAMMCLALSASAQTKPKAPPPPGLLNDPLLQQLVSLDLKDASINQAVAELAKIAKVSLIVERPASMVARPITLALHQARLRDVMDMLGQLYGYRWRQKNGVFLLTIVPQKQDMEEFGKEAMKTIYEQVLTPEQRAKVDADGFISGKDLTPGQQGILAGYLQDMMSMALSSNMSIGRVVIDRANKKLGIDVGNGDGQNNKTP